MKKLEHKRELINRHNLKDSADDFIQGNQDKLSLTSNEKIYDQSEYLKKQFMNRKKKLKKAHEVFSDNIETEDDELLYDDELENSQIKNIKTNSKLLNSVSAQRAISDLNDIKNEKEEDNHEFKRNLEEFSKLFINNKLKEFEDSDELKTAQQRLSSKNMYYILRKRMEEMKKARIKFYLALNSVLLKKIKNKKNIKYKI